MILFLCKSQKLSVHLGHCNSLSIFFELEMLRTDLISPFGLLLGCSRSSPTKKVGTLRTCAWGAHIYGINPAAGLTD